MTAASRSTFARSATSRFSERNMVGSSVVPGCAPIVTKGHHHAVTREVASEAVELFDTWVRKPLRASDLPEEEKAERLVEAFRTLMPAVAGLVAHHFQRILLQVAQEHLESVGDPSELDAAAADEAWSA